MPRPASAALAALALGLTCGCAQVLGIGDPSTCPVGTDYCDGVCVDTRFDQDNCGGCGISCYGASCVENTCVNPDCSKELARCTAPGSATLECDGLDCVEFAAFTNPVCLRRCDRIAQCPADMFCAPADGNAYAQGFPAYQLISGHCVISLCGGNAGTAAANGTLNGPCQVGGDAYLKAGTIAERYGTCVAAAAGVGQCVDAGDVARDDACTFQPQGCVPRDEYASCHVGDLCIGSSGAAAGTCAQLCDPTKTGQCGGKSCTALSGGAGYCR
ncbi:MAG TPA: hypothetical protein VGQ83_21540 [Polyangia bacterium]|jgi:hypothetical protein